MDQLGVSRSSEREESRALTERRHERMGEQVHEQVGNVSGCCLHNKNCSWVVHSP
jgi:hypothetical protein